MITRIDGQMWMYIATGPCPEGRHVTQHLFLFLSACYKSAAVDVTPHTWYVVVLSAVAANVDGVLGLDLQALHGLMFLDLLKIVSESSSNIGENIEKSTSLLTFGRLQIDYGWMKPVSLGFTAVTAAWKGFATILKRSWEQTATNTDAAREKGSLRGEHMTTAKPHILLMSPSSNEKVWLWPGR